MRQRSELEALVGEWWGKAMVPPAALGVAEWADRFRELSNSVSPEPGPWRTDRVPYLRGIMETLSPESPARIITVQKGSQIGATECSLNWVGHTVDHGAGSMLIVLPSMETAKEWSKQRLSQLTETPCLRGKILDSRKRDSGNTYASKRFAGGFLKIAWATSAKKLRSMPASMILADETDAFGGDVMGEGDPVPLLKRRFSNFPRGKLLLLSSPTLKHLISNRARIRSR